MLIDRPHEHRPGRMAAAVCAALFVTLLDGFDAFSLSLAGPGIVKQLGLPTAALGAIFASAMGGMIVGAFGGGLLADKLGRLRVAILSLALFGGAAFLVPWADTVMALIANRAVAGLGLGAAVPIAVALLNGASRRPPSDLIVSLVIAGIPAGGILAALYNYTLVPEHGWQSLFFAGGLLPIPAAALAYLVFHRQGRPSTSRNDVRRARLSDLLAPHRAMATVITAGMFLCGYVNTSVVVNWLPTILSHGGASAATVSVAFGAVSGGSLAGVFGLGLLSSRLRSPWTLAVAWGCAGLLAFAASASALTATVTAVLAIASITVAAGAQGLAVAFANRLHSDAGLESTTVGLMVSAGRIGQFLGLTASGALLARGMPERGVFAIAGVCACAAAALAVLAVRAAIDGRSSRIPELPPQRPSGTLEA